MFGIQPVLAQAAEGSSSAGGGGNASLTPLLEGLQGRLDLLTQPDQLIATLENVDPLRAGILIVIGAISVINGYAWHKPLVVILAGIAGVTAGLTLGPQVGGTGVVPAVALGLLFAVLALPLMRYTVALFAGLVGAFVGANCWTAFGGLEAHHHYGAIIGLVAMGLLAFLAFRVVIMAFTSIGGASLLTLGIIAALLDMPGLGEGIQTSIRDNHRVAPIIAASTAALGFIVQWTGGFRGLNEAADRADPGKAKSKAEAKPA